MGNSYSVQDVTNTTLNKVAMEVMTRNSTNLSASSDQSNVFNFNGNTGTNVNGFKQNNSSKINIKSLSQAASTGTLQSDLSTALKNAVDQAIPSLSVNSNQSQKIKNTITNSVNTKITTENLTKLAAQVTQSNIANIGGNIGGNINNISQDNSAELILELVNDVSSDIVSAVKASGAVDNTTSQKASSLFGDIGSMYIIMIIVIFVILGGGTYYLTTLGWQDLMKPIPLAVIGSMVASSIFGILYIGGSSE